MKENNFCRMMKFRQVMFIPHLELRIFQKMADEAGGILRMGSGQRTILIELRQSTLIQQENLYLLQVLIHRWKIYLQAYSTKNKTIMI